MDKKRIIDWVTFILNLVVALLFIGLVTVFFVSLVFLPTTTNCPLGCNFALGAVVYGLLSTLWVRYLYRLIILKHGRTQPTAEKLAGTPAPPPKGEKIRFLLFFLACVIGVFLVFFSFKGCLGRGNKDVIVQAASYEETFSLDTRGKWLIKKLVPEGAHEIEYFHHPSVFRGEYAFMRCSCTQEELKKFASKHGYDFQGEDMTRNANLDGAKNGYSIEPAWRHFYPDFATCPPYPEKFLAYNYIFRNHGGTAFLYDVEKEILYARWSSN